MPRTRNKFVEIVSLAECYLITNHVKNKEAKNEPFRLYLPVKLPDSRMSMKKGKNSSHLNNNVVSLGKMAGKLSL